MDGQTREEEAPARQARLTQTGLFLSPMLNVWLNALSDNALMFELVILSVEYLQAPVAYIQSAPAVYPLESRFPATIA